MIIFTPSPSRPHACLLTYPASSSPCLSVFLCLSVSVSPIPPHQVQFVLPTYSWVGALPLKNTGSSSSRSYGSSAPGLLGSAWDCTPHPVLRFSYLACSLTFFLYEDRDRTSNFQSVACTCTYPTDAKGLGRRPSHAHPAADMLKAFSIYSLTGSCIHVYDEH